MMALLAGPRGLGGFRPLKALAGQGGAQSDPGENARRATAGIDRPGWKLPEALGDFIHASAQNLATKPADCPVDLPSAERVVRLPVDRRVILSVIDDPVLTLGRVKSARPMTILCPIKRVPDPYAKPRPLPDGSGLDTTSLKFEINPFDEIALEQAVRLKEADAAIEIVCVSVGSSACEEQLRKALAIGADRAILVETEVGLDCLGVAKELHAIVKSVESDLVLMGKQATDDDANQVGQMLAALLGWPQATFAASVHLEGRTLRVTRETDDGEETLELPLPAVVTADLRLAEPRYIALPAIIKARNKPVDRVSTTIGATPQVVFVSMEPAPARAPGRVVASVDELVESLKGLGVL